MSEEVKEEKTKKPMNKKVKKVLLQSGGFLSSIAPILVVIGLNWTDYTSSTPSIISLKDGILFLNFLTSLIAIVLNLATLIFIFLKSNITFLLNV